MDNGFWNPITLSRDGPPITHLCFADDLFIFAEASMEQVEVIKDCLDIFAASSGQKISKEKTWIFFSKNVHYSRALKISNEFGFSIIGDLRKYLGVPLKHKRASSSFFSHITDRVMKRLSAWKANSLSLAGRLTLCSSVVSAIPIYDMQTALLPSSTCFKLDSMNKKFLWGAVENRKIYPCS